MTNMVPGVRANSAVYSPPQMDVIQVMPLPTRSDFVFHITHKVPGVRASAQLKDRLTRRAPASVLPVQSEEICLLYGQLGGRQESLKGRAVRRLNFTASCELGAVVCRLTDLAFANKQHPSSHKRPSQAQISRSTQITAHHYR